MKRPEDVLKCRVEAENRLYDEALLLIEKEIDNQFRFLGDTVILHLGMGEYKRELLARIALTMDKYGWNMSWFPINPRWTIIIKERKE